MLTDEVPEASPGLARSRTSRRRRRRRVLVTTLAVAILACCGLTARLFLFPAQGMPGHVDAIVMMDGPGDRLRTAEGLA